MVRYNLIVEFLLQCYLLLFLFVLSLHSFFAAVDGVLFFSKKSVRQWLFIGTSKLFSRGPFHTFRTLLSFPQSKKIVECESFCTPRRNLLNQQSALDAAVGTIIVSSSTIVCAITIVSSGHHCCWYSRHHFHCHYPLLMSVVLQTSSTTVDGGISIIISSSITIISSISIIISSSTTVAAVLLSSTHHHTIIGTITIYHCRRRY